MKKFFIFSALLVAFFQPPPVQAQQSHLTVTKEQALSIVKGLFQGKDVDYYLCNDPVLHVKTEGQNFLFIQNDAWTFFVDAEPLKGWEHDCYLVKVEKHPEKGRPFAPQSTQLRLPPNGDFTPLDVKNRYGATYKQKPYVKKVTLSNEGKMAAEHTYAVILSGGHNKYSNYERYWNDCSFVYQTLVNKYGVPKRNISVVMSDGMDPAADMMTTAGGFKSSPLDLDYDGFPDIKYAATRTNVKNVLFDLSQKIGKDDHLFFYVIDHGGTRDNENQSYICLWNAESLYDYELANWLRPFNEKSVYVNVVLGQCFSGGFIPELNKVGCFVATASKGDEPSWACQNIPYDEFVYQWTSAINESNHLGDSIFSDTDKNHRVTMEEAFSYAKRKDRAPEHPQCCSNPISVGEDLAFNNLPKAVDLYIKDNDKDTGKEPNQTTAIFWDSPSIWVRNKRDGIERHENPYLSDDHLCAVIYVKIHNRGKENYYGGKYLHMYWARASTGLTTKAWKGQEYYINHAVTGGHMDPKYIEGPIKAGESKTMFVAWSLPDGLTPSGNGTEEHHFCLLGQISDTGDPELKGKYPAVLRDNNIAQKNVSVICKEKTLDKTIVFVRNIESEAQMYSLEIRPRTLADKALLSRAKLKMEMAPSIYKAWKLGGCHSKDITYAPAINPQKVEFNSWNARLEGIYMKGSDFEKVAMSIDFRTPAVAPGEHYTFDLIQKDKNGKIVGGETFIVEAPLYSYKPIEIVPIEIEKGKYELTTGLEEKAYSFRWTDKNGEDIGVGNKITVTPTSKNNEFSVTALSSQGEMTQESITLESKTGLKSVTPTSVDDFLDVELYEPVNSTGALLRINSLTQGGMVLLSSDFPVGSKQMRLDVSSLPSGMYVLTYSVNGQIIGRQKFNKK